jgi:hypothetical protein
MTQVAKRMGHGELPMLSLNCVTSNSVDPVDCQSAESAGRNQSSCSCKWNW